jgi:hypothetical protein
MRKLVPTLSIACLTALAPAVALAQDPAPTTPAPAAMPAPEPAPAAPLAAEPVPATTEAPMEAAPVVEAAPEAAPVEEETFPAAWFRFDSDAGMFQAWAGATYALTDTIGLATDIYVNSANLGEFDIGPAFTLGPTFLTPMLGVQWDWTNHKTAAIVPQLYFTGGPDPIYFEFWFQNYNYAAFTEGAANSGYIRFFIDYKVGKYFAFGPQIEATFAFNDGAKVGDESLTSLPVGGNIMLTNYGKNNTGILFLGYEAAKNFSPRDLVGRLTFIHNF